MKTIREVAETFKLTPRTLRYYEEIGLLSPTRTETNQRLYDKKEIAKIKLIERGKRYNFNLDEIKEMILLFDTDRSGKAQLKRTIEYGKEKKREINERMKELQEIKREITELERLFIQRIKEIEKEEEIK